MADSCGHQRKYALGAPAAAEMTLFGHVYDLADEARRLDQDLLARRMTDWGGLRAHARRYRELKDREPSWEVPELSNARASSST